MIHAEIRVALEALGYPVEFGWYEGEDPTYITYIQYDEAPRLNANNQEIATTFYYQINVFSTSDYSELVKNIKIAMRDLDGDRIDENESVYPDNWYHRSIRFKFTKYTGGY
jgi:hypothetical protein